MAAKKGGLGKGLGALLVENEVEQGNAVSLRIADITPNRGQPRRQFDDEPLRELAESIAQHGVLQPLLVRPLTSGGYQLVAGERRWRAARMAGLTEVPVVIREMTEREAAELALIENLQREDLNPMEEAQGYRTLMETYGLTQEEAAKAVNKSRPTVTNALRLLHLPKEVSGLLEEGKLSAGHARAILSFDTEAEQIAAAQQVLQKQLSVRAVEQMARAAHNEQKRAEKAGGDAAAPFYEEVALALNAQLGRRVKVIPGKKGGVLQLEFYDEADLQKLANRIGREE